MPTSKAPRDTTPPSSYEKPKRPCVYGSCKFALTVCCCAAFDDQAMLLLNSLAPSPILANAHRTTLFPVADKHDPVAVRRPGGITVCASELVGDGGRLFVALQVENVQPLHTAVGDAE
jgi:hypothetical protein